MWKNKKIRFLLLAELVLILAGCIGLLSGERRVAGLEDMQISMGGGEYPGASGEYHINESLHTGETFLRAVYGVIPKGIYRLELSAEGTADNSLEIEGESGRFRTIRSDGMDIPAGNGVYTCLFRVSGRAEHAVIKVNYHGAGELVVKELRIVKTNLGSRRFLAMTVFLSALINVLALLYLRMSEKEVTSEKKLVWFGVPAIALVASFPVLTDYILSEARSVFFFDSFLVLQRLMQALGFDAVVSYNGYIAAVNVATALLAYVSFRGIFRSSAAGVLGSLLYTLAPCRMDCAFDGNALDVFTAMTFLPLVLWGAWEVSRDGGEETARRAEFLIPTLGFTGMMQSHMPSGLAAVFCWGLLCLFFGRKIPRKKILWKRGLTEILKTAVATLLLNAWLLVPFAEMAPGLLAPAQTQERSLLWKNLGMDFFARSVLAIGIALCLCGLVAKVYVSKDKFAKTCAVLLTVCGPVLYSLYRGNELLLTNTINSRPYELGKLAQPFTLSAAPGHWYAAVGVSALTAAIMLTAVLIKKRHKNIH